MFLRMIGIFLVLVASPIFGWNECGFQVKLDKIKLKTHFAKKNPRDQLVIQAWTEDPGDFYASVRHVETIHEDFLNQDFKFASKPEAGNYYPVAAYECLSDNYYKKLPKRLHIRITQVNGWNSTVLDEVYDIAGVYGRGNPYTAINKDVELEYQIIRMMGTPNHL